MKKFVRHWYHVSVYFAGAVTVLLALGNWNFTQTFLPIGKRRGRPYTRDRRVIVEAIGYHRQTGCAWHALPKHVPPYQTVHTQLREWQKREVWAKIWEDLEQPRATT